MNQPRQHDQDHPPENDHDAVDHDAVEHDAVEQGRETPWLHLHPLTWIAGVAITGAILLGVGIVTAIIMLIAGVSPLWTVLGVLGGVIVCTALIGAVEMIRVRATRYRIHNDRLQLRFQFIGSSTRSLPLSRIRTIDLTADLVQRLFGLTSVRFGTGDQSGSKFSLSTLSQTDAEQLRRTILGESSAGQPGASTDRPDVGRLASFELGWIKYAPVSLGVPVLGVAAFGAVVQIADWFSMVPQLWGLVSGLMVALILPLQIVVLLVIALVIGAVGSMIIFVEAWWGYQLDRDADGTLHLQRGLFVRRSSSFSGARIRGVTLEEPLGYRRAGAAKLKIVAVGLQQPDSNQNQQVDQSTIVPAVPRAVAVAVAETIIGRTFPTELAAHPPAASLRRYRWAGLTLATLLVLLAVPAILWLPTLWSVVAGVAVVGIPITWWLARDNARGLGHLITDDHVVIRTGSVFRSSTVLTRNGLLGWNLRQSPGQRRLGLVTLVATSAASPGHFRLPDIDPAEAPAVQQTAGPVWDHLWAPSN